MKKVPKKAAARKKAVRRIRRSAEEAEVVTEAEARKHPATTVTETIKK